MGPNARTRRTAATVKEHAGSQLGHLRNQSIFERLEPLAVAIRTRRRQKLAITSDQEDTLYLIRRGFMLAQASLPGNRTQILSILTPGDVYRTAAMPPLAGTALTSTNDQGEVWRVRWPVVCEGPSRDAALENLLSRQLAEQAARLALHAAIVGGLTGEERVASLYAELALRTGKVSHAGVTFEMPISRVDIAEYLSLNADTVSRIVSRMRAKGLIAEAGRGFILCRDIEALMRECPVARTLEAMHSAKLITAQVA